MKGRRKKHPADQRYIPVDIDRLPKETADTLKRLHADLKAAEPAAKATRELHERFAKRAAYRAAVRDGLLPPPWMKRQPAASDNLKPGSAAAWIAELYPHGEWRLMTAKGIHQTIEREAKARGLNKWPSYSAVRSELKAAQKTQKAQR
jgi:hypothetical protein